VLSAHEGNGAECAAVIATLADLEIANVRHAAGVHAHAGMVGERIA
jgi:hypothetical protein